MITCGSCVGGSGSVHLCSFVDRSCTDPVAWGSLKCSADNSHLRASGPGVVCAGLVKASPGLCPALSHLDVLVHRLHHGRLCGKKQVWCIKPGSVKPLRFQFLNSLDKCRSFQWSSSILRANSPMFGLQELLCSAATAVLWTTWTHNHKPQPLTNQFTASTFLLDNQHLASYAGVGISL